MERSFVDSKPRFCCLSCLFYIVQLVSATLPVPQWLEERTGLSQWPGYEAPYIAEAHHHMDSISDCAIRAYGECTPERDVTMECSYDCDHCTRHTDITSCDVLSQTFDDGPSSATPRLLEQLKKHKAKTSFFLLGINILDYPHTVLKEHKDGHLLGVHTWSHKFLPALTNEEVFAELQWCIWAVNASAGFVPRYFRPPYGGVDNRIRDIAEQLGLKTVLWDHDTLDWKLHDGSRAKSDVLGEVSNWAKDHPSRKWYQFKAPKAKGLILEHDLSEESVGTAIEILNSLKGNQKRVDKCRK